MHIHSVYQSMDSLTTVTHSLCGVWAAVCLLPCGDGCWRECVDLWSVHLSHTAGSQTDRRTSTVTHTHTRWPACLIVVCVWDRERGRCVFPFTRLGECVLSDMGVCIMVCPSCLWYSVLFSCMRVCPPSPSVGILTIDPRQLDDLINRLTDSDTCLSMERVDLTAVTRGTHRQTH